MRGQRDKHAAEEAKAAGEAVEVIEPCYDDPFPDYDPEPVMAYANG
jgi:hypothetical protein